MGDAGAKYAKHPDSQPPYRLVRAFSGFRASWVLQEPMPSYSCLPIGRALGLVCFIGVWVDRA